MEREVNRGAGKEPGDKGAEGQGRGAGTRGEVEYYNI